MKKLVTADEIRSTALKGGGEVYIGKDRMITPGARDLAVELGVKVIFGQPPGTLQAQEPVSAGVFAGGSGKVIPYVPIPESLRAAGNLQSPGCPPTLAVGKDPGLVDRVTRIVMERAAGGAGDKPGEELIRAVVSAVINRLGV